MYVVYFVAYRDGLHVMFEGHPSRYTKYKPNESVWIIPGTIGVD